MNDLLQFEVPTGRDEKGEALHWKAPGCRFVNASCTSGAFNCLGGYMYGVALSCIEEIVRYKVEAEQVEPDGSVTVYEADLELLSRA